MLIVDDERSVCVSLAYLLEYAGYRVLTADSGSAAVALAENEVVDGALIDIHMPVMNGFDTWLRLRERATALGRPLRAWFITGGFSRDLERRGAEVGALGVIRKPFEHQSFLALLEEGFSSSLPPVGPSTSDKAATSVPL